MSELTTRYLCKVYAPLVRTSSVVTANSPSPSGALTSAMKGAQKIPLHQRTGLTFEVIKVVRVHAKGAFRRVPTEPMYDLTNCPTLC